MTYRIPLALLIVLVAAGWTAGQVPLAARPVPAGVRMGPGGRVAMPGGPAPTVAPNPADSAATAASAVGLLGSARGCRVLLAVSILQARSSLAPAPESPRLMRLRQLQFDRRPSTILQAWAQRPPSTSKGSKEPPKTPLDVELETFQKNVTLGNWPAVKKYLAGLPAAEGKAAYQQMLQSLQGNPPFPGNPGAVQMPMMMGPGGPMPLQRLELNAFTAADVLGLAAAAPGKLETERITSLGAILQRALAGHTVVPDAIRCFQNEVEKGAGKAALTARQAAQLFMAAGEPVAAGTFLPGLDKAVAQKDAEGLNLLARHFIGLHASQKKAVFLERAWSATQAALALDNAKTEEKSEAVRRAVELAPKIKEELGQAWLDQSFTAHPDRGMDILATIGSVAAQGLQTSPQREDRLKVVQLLKTAVDALIKAAPQRAAQWRSSLTLLASIWVREADYTRQMDPSKGRTMRTGRFSFVFWGGDPDMMLRQQNQPLPIHTNDLLLTRPTKGWMDVLDAGTRAKLSILLAQLYLKVGDEKNAFPLIEELAPTNKEAARALVNEFLDVWTTTHDPNGARRDENFFMFGWSPPGTGDSIPLTRSKQERNLVELAGWVERIRRLPLERLDEEQLVQAFTKCHSSAEVFRLDHIEKVFGSLGKIKPRTLATLIQTTRSNLAGLWREPAEQQKKKTKRKQKDIEAEVLRGYALAGTVVSNALKQFPDDWALNLAQAALLHDETNYRQEVARTSDYSAKRTAAIAAFQKAAALYADQVKKLSEDEETIAVYQQWFYASLGACDLTQITDEKLPDPRQAPLIRKAILALPGDLAERHMNKMAESLATNLSSVQPTARYRYLQHGFDIVGENKEAMPARKVFDYYKDLVTEIKLDVIIDGSDRVGHGEPFGVFVNLRHTREIEREAGGFGRFLQNQSTQLPAFYQIPKDLVDYRDRFQAVVTDALKEQFDIRSITFQTDKVHSRAAPEYGWRVTPYAYLLLKPKGPQVDKIPPLHLDLDFEDTATDYTDFFRRSVGKVVLPIESAAVPIDATAPRGEPRPVRKLQITQILDERQGDLGKLGLEIKASGIGLVGPLDETLNLAPEGFEVVRADDQGLSIAKYDDDGEGIAVVSERTWLMELRARSNQGMAPHSFRFAAPRVEDAEMIYQRYQDADLATAGPEVLLEHEYRGRGKAWVWVGGIALGALVLLLLLAVALRLRRRPRAAAAMHLPEKLTPFTVTMLLRRIQQNPGLSDADKAALEEAIDEVERRYFADGHGNGEINLRALAEGWVRKVK